MIKDWEISLVLGKKFNLMEYIEISGGTSLTRTGDLTIMRARDLKHQHYHSNLILIAHLSHHDLIQHRGEQPKRQRTVAPC